MLYCAAGHFCTEGEDKNKCCYYCEKNTKLECPMNCGRLTVEDPEKFSEKCRYIVATKEEMENFDFFRIPSRIEKK